MGVSSGNMEWGISFIVCNGNADVGLMKGLKNERSDDDGGGWINCI